MRSTPISGPKVLLVAALLVMLIGGTAGWWMLRSRPRGGAYIDTLALDAETVVALRREETADRAFVEMVDVRLGDTGLRWQALVPRYRVPEGAIGVGASDHAITVRFPRDGHTQAFGFATDSARKLGSVILGDGLPREDDGHVADGVATLSGGRTTFEIFQPDDAPARVYAVSLMDGEIAWQRDLPEHDIVATWVTERYLVVTQPASTTVIARDGHVDALEPGGGCVIPGAGIDVLVREVDGALTTRTLEDGSSGLSVPLDGARFLQQCGRRGSRIAAIVDRGGAGEVWLVGADAPRRIELGAGVPVPATVAAPLALPFSGELDAVAPIVLDTSIVGVDLDRETIAWRSRPSEALRGAVVVDAGAAVLIRAGELLASIDPATGAARAVRVPDTRPLRAHNVAGGAVWIAGDRGLVALDVVTLEPLRRWRTPPAVEPASVDALGLNP